jgi:hypothetical protein
MTTFVGVVDRLRGAAMAQTKFLGEKEQRPTPSVTQQN